MRFFIDSEFISDGKTIDLVSIGVVSETGDEFYAQSSEFDASKASAWVKEHVLTHLEPGGYSREIIKIRLFNFIKWQCTAGKEKEEPPEFWGDYCAFDFVILSQLYGTFDDWPPGWPFFMHDLQQHIAWVEIRPSSEFRLPDEVEHHALHDARSIKRQYDDVTSIIASFEEE